MLRANANRPARHTWSARSERCTRIAGPQLVAGRCRALRFRVRPCGCYTGLVGCWRRARFSRLACDCRCRDWWTRDGFEDRERRMLRLRSWIGFSHVQQLK